MFEMSGGGFSAAGARRFEARLNRPKNRGASRRSGFCSQNSLMHEINVSFVPFSVRFSAPAISCRSGFFFKLSAPVNG
jgi:hypothetical protein